MASPIAATQAYASVAKLSEAAGLVKAGSEASGGQGFASLLKDALGAVNQAGQNSDKQAQAMAAGKANIIDVVTAVAYREPGGNGGPLT